jgi:hypothetical protein
LSITGVHSLDSAGGNPNRRQVGHRGAAGDIWSEEVLATVILPAYNEESALPLVLDALFDVADDRYEILVVDDGSTDGTVAAAQRYPCRVISHDCNRGKGSAVRTGLESARGRYVVIMDADATYPAGAVPGVVELLRENQLVRCIRRRCDGSMPLVNRVGNRIFDFLLSAAHGVDGSDCLSGLYGLHREVLQGMNLEADGFDLEVEIGIKASAQGLRTGTIPIAYHERVGEKKLDAWRDGWRILSRVLFMLLTHNPVLTFIGPGLSVMVVGVLGAIVLCRSALVTPYFGLDVHSFILAALGILGGFQLVVFGLAAKLYSIEVGCKPDRWMVRVSAVRSRMTAAGAGLLLFVAGLIWTATMAVEWLLAAPGNFEQTRELVMAAAVAVGGLQLLSASLFVSIFAARIQKQFRDTSSQGPARANQGVQA